MFEDGEDEMTTMLDAWFEECVRFLGQNDAWRDDAALDRRKVVLCQHYVRCGFTIRCGNVELEMQQSLLRVMMK